MDYNSFRDRQPSTAVTVKTDVTFTLHGEDQTTASLLLAKDGADYDTIAMTQVVGGFTLTVTPPTPGLWFYAFALGDGRFLSASMAGLGGPAQIVAELSQVQPYQLTVAASFDAMPSWYQDAQIYHIFVDRFNNGNQDGRVLAPKANSFLYGQLTDDPYYVKDAAGEVVRWDFYGGNLAGITAKLDWLQQQGYTALYLSPIFEAASNHRYDTADYFHIDPMLGDLSAFKALVAGLHQRGMRLILDGVFNHVGRDSRYFNAVGHYPTVGAAQSPTSPYYDWFTFKHYPDDYASWWGVADLPAINKTSQSFHDFIAGGPDSVIGYWTGLGVDGWRLDVVDELDTAFVTQIRQLLDQYPDRVLIGEVWEDASNKVAYGQRKPYLLGGSLQAVMNYPQRELMVQFAAGQMPAAAVAQRLLTMQANYPPAVFAYNFTSLGTHDTERLKTLLPEAAQLRQAVLLWTVLPGNRVIYYGDEAGLTGGRDPQNRKYYPWGHEDAATMALYAEATHWRQLPALHGAAAFWTFAMEAGLVVVRQSAAQVVVAYFNPTNGALLFSPPALATGLPPALQELLPTVLVQAHDQVLQTFTQSSFGR